MELHKDTPVFLFQTQKEWEEWLHKNYDKLPAVWVKFAKKNSGVVSATYDDALQVALCYGWIDGLINTFDDTYYLTRFTPRKAKSIWSKTNKEAIERLIAEGKMQPGGFATIEAAKANGSWDAAYDGSKNIEVPKEFLEQLSKDKKAEAFFKLLNRANFYAIAWRLQTAKSPQIQAKRMEKILDMLKKGEKIH